MQTRMLPALECVTRPSVGFDPIYQLCSLQIRVNFYVTILLIAVVPETPETRELLSALYSNAGLSGLGLLVTAIVQTAANQLSLFHAIFIFHIIFALGISASSIGE
jgi:hypothetical protein